MEELLSKCKEASKKLQLLTEDDVNKCLLNIKDALIKNKDFILKENQKDINNAKGVIKDSMIDRLTLNDKRILALASSIDDVISLPFYPGEVIEEIKRPNGLLIKKVRVPFGVIASIFESRPNVSVDISVLGLKTLNAVVLKGGKEAINTNIALCKVMRDAIKDIVDPHVITLIESTNREDTNKLLTMKDYIDLMILHQII
jgi:glutamate-5-semialdehyde dehydrogenase